MAYDSADLRGLSDKKNRFKFQREAASHGSENWTRVGGSSDDNSIVEIVGPAGVFHSPGWIPFRDIDSKYNFHQ